MEIKTSRAKEFAKLMGILAEVFDNKEPSALKIELYYQILGKYDIEQLSTAVQSMIAARVYPSFPKPAEIIEAIQGKTEERAIKAWIEVVKALREIGTHQSVKFNNPVIHSVIEAMGGWLEIGKTRTDDMKWKQKEFERLYSIMEAQGNHPEYLPGQSEISNIGRGYTENVKAPIEIPKQRRLRMLPKR